MQSTAASRPDATTVGGQRELNRHAYERIYVPISAKLACAFRGKWVAIVGGRLYPEGRGTEWRPYEDHLSADLELRRLSPHAAHRYVFRIGDEGDRDVFLGVGKETQVLGSGFCTAIPEIKCWEYLPSGELRGQHRGKVVSLGSPQPDDPRPHVTLTLNAPLGEQPHVEQILCASGGTNSILIRHSLAEHMRLELWEVPGAATMSRSSGPSTTCRRAYVNGSLHAEGFELERVFLAEIWPDDRRADGVKTGL